MEINIKRISSPNFTKGREGEKVRAVCLHITEGNFDSSLGFARTRSLGSYLGWMISLKSQVSAHYLVGERPPYIIQLVSEEDTAWHASNLTVNRESIGIEHEGGWLLQDQVNRFKPTDKTHETSAKLVAEVCKRYSIPIDSDHILPHNKFSATQCPGDRKSVV